MGNDHVQELKELEQTFEEWGMKKGDAILLGLSLVYPHIVSMGDEKLTTLASSFRESPFGEGRCGMDVIVIKEDS